MSFSASSGVSIVQQFTFSPASCSRETYSLLTQSPQRSASKRYFSINRRFSSVSLAREELNRGVGIKTSQNDEVFPAERDEFRLIQPPHVFDDRRDCRDVPFFHPVFKFEDCHLIIFAADSDIIFERGQKQVAAAGNAVRVGQSHRAKVREIALFHVHVHARDAL